ncbi:DUF1090 domain-containing protein [Salmonella enterica]|uniref:DUF1090 domain-containing protein n=2 Tax=Salmonella enterica TaxID=28901 RepID=A0A612C7X9_SALMO|nr:DUF1090 domain-containing protein [Salmonella enterica]EBG9603147.1 DUF1090 domain-containing protein [Salmonella enterica subsp. enterica serovar Arechavaleta]EBV0540257.1 DUF1090 domain-containing protein [Salmonella enterica subsp. enterica serovar Glostrup]EBW3178379.1 DUF1090 domain-containing protein [Salmonella enterica subsp. enterica serovar Javiana]ECT8456513.1 DUF1090 domain-containing protein [Salmonella enterica subsp. enterica serovar Panama]ECV9759221.1 DUF1090 domain-contain
MKYIKIIPPTTFVLLLSIQSYATPPVGCAAKKQEVENQITYAREHNNTHQIAGLQKALREIEEHCTDPQLLRQRQLKIAEKEQKVAERQAELEQAKETGNPQKIAQKQKKLDHAREELQDAQLMLYK